MSKLIGPNYPRILITTFNHKKNDQKLRQSKANPESLASQYILHYCYCCYYNRFISS